MTDVIVTEVEAATIIEVVSEGPPGPPGPQGPIGPPGNVTQYTAVNVPSYTITAAALIEGLNIFGVTYTGGQVTITLPAEISPTRVVVVKDETGNAAANNIVIQTA